MDSLQQPSLKNESEFLVQSLFPLEVYFPFMMAIPDAWTVKGAWWHDDGGHNKDEKGKKSGHWANKDIFLEGEDRGKKQIIRQTDSNRFCDLVFIWEIKCFSQIGTNDLAMAVFRNCVEVAMAFQHSSAGS